MGRSTGGGFQRTRNLDPFFSVPIDAGLLSLADLHRRGPDGEPVVTLDMVADLNEILVVRHNNEVRARNRAQYEAQKNRRSR